MATLKSPSLLALKSFRNLVTFSTWNGLLIARKTAGPLGPARTKGKRYVTNLMRAANTALSNLTLADRDLFKRAAANSSFTWKDLYTSLWFRSAHELGQPPMVISDASAKEVGADVQLEYAVGNYQIIDETGWGSIAWGSHPYGADSRFNVPAGDSLLINYSVALVGPIPHPSADQNKPAYGRTLCLTPGEPDVLSEGPPDTVGAATYYATKESFLPLPIRTDPHTGADCPTAWAAAWNAFINAPITWATTRTDSTMWVIRTNGGTGWPTQIRFAGGLWTLITPRQIIPASWHLVTTVKYVYTTGGPTDWTPWKQTITLEGETLAITKGSTSITFTKPPAYAKTFQLLHDTNKVEPPSLCNNQGNLASNITNLNPGLGFTTLEYVSQSTGSLPIPNREYNARLLRAAGNPPVLCPPIQVT